MTYTFGIEMEVGSGSADLLEALGLHDIHSYHCGCDRCYPDRPGPDFTAQEDCTVDAEFISRILPYNDEGMEAIEDLGEAVRKARCGYGGFRDVGLHIHVGHEDLPYDDDAMRRFWRLWFHCENDIERMAAGSRECVRGYNAPVSERHVGAPSVEVMYRSDEWIPGHTYRDSWVATRTNHSTFEFRVWNSTRATWRIHLAVGVSVALVAAASDGVNVTLDDERTLPDLLGPYMTDESYAAMLRFYMMEANR